MATAPLPVPPPANCAHCSTPCSLYCSNCKGVAYCSQEHQKQHRKVHKAVCFPIKICQDSQLGQHLVASRAIKAGELIFKEQPLIIGPRTNLGSFAHICLGCCAQIKSADVTVHGHGQVNVSACNNCKWPMCSPDCEKVPLHVDFECPILANSKIPPPTTQEEYLSITVLRCLLLKDMEPNKWEQLLNFESHAEARSLNPGCVQQSKTMCYMIREKFGLRQFDFNIIDFIYGVLVVNGYGDASTFSIKLYSNASKISNSCIPNTTSSLIRPGAAAPVEAKNGRLAKSSSTPTMKSLQVLATVDIPTGAPLTQLYGRILKGTIPRQQLFQAIYYFTCGCRRCTDPTELGTYFSALKCSSGKRCTGYLLPVKLNAGASSTTSTWKCTNCSSTKSYSSGILPVLKSVEEQIGAADLGDDGLYCEYEFQQEGAGEKCWDPVEVLKARVQHVQEMLGVLGRVQGQLLHPNHYALLPLKTALIATIHSLIKVSPDSNWTMLKTLLPPYLQLTEGVLELISVFLPGLTSERGVILFYYSEGLKFSQKLELCINGGPVAAADKVHPLDDKASRAREESKKIMLLQPEDDEQRKMILHCLENDNYY